MPFCTSCGKEVASGKKFCEYCGTPLEQPAAAPAAPVTPSAVPAAPVLPQAAPGKPAGGSGKIMIIAGIIVVLAIIAGVYLFGLPLMRGTPETTTLPTQALTPFPTIPFEETTSAPVTVDTPSGSQTYEEKYTETYNQVYSVNHAFVGGQKMIYTQDLAAPPLYIKFNITPKMFYEERPVEIGLHSEHIANISYTSQNAWFKVRVYDADNGELKEEQGFNKEHGIMTQQEFMIRAPGNYRVEFSGNDVTAEVRILTGKS